MIIFDMITIPYDSVKLISDRRGPLCIPQSSRNAATSAALIGSAGFLRVPEVIEWLVTNDTMMDKLAGYVFGTYCSVGAKDKKNHFHVSVVLRGYFSPHFQHCGLWDH